MFCDLLLVQVYAAPERKTKICLNNLSKLKLSKVNNFIPFHLGNLPFLSHYLTSQITRYIYDYLVYHTNVTYTKAFLYSTVSSWFQTEPVKYYWYLFKT